MILSNLISHFGPNQFQTAFLLRILSTNYWLFDNISTNRPTMLKVDKPELTAQLIEANLKGLSQQVGSQSFLDWSEFTTSFSSISTSLDELQRMLPIYTELHQRNMLLAMKKLKGLDLPDLIGTVMAKRLPKEALKAAVDNLQLKDGTVVLKMPAAQIKKEAQTVFKQYMDQCISLRQDINNLATKLKTELKTAGKEIPTADVRNKADSHVTRLNEAPPSSSGTSGSSNSMSLAQFLDAPSSTAVVVTSHPNNSSLISLETYTQIVKATYPQIKQQFNELTTKSREKQRNLRNNPKLYLDAMMTYVEECERLMAEGQYKVCDKAGVNREKFEMSQMALMEEGKMEQVMVVQSQLRAKVKQVSQQWVRIKCICLEFQMQISLSSFQQLKITICRQSLPIKETLSVQKAKQILNYQLELFSTHGDILKKTVSHLPAAPETLQLIPMILALALSDLVYDKYKYQEEEYMRPVADQLLSSAPEFMTLLKSMQQAVMKFMMNLDQIPQEMRQMMMMGANMMMNGQGM